MSRKKTGLIIATALAVILIIAGMYLIDFFKEDNSDGKVETLIAVNDLGDSWYELRSVFTWTATPEKRFRDAIAISSSQSINWVQGGDFNYHSTFSYTETTKDKSERIILTKTTPEQSVIEPDSTAHVVVGLHAMYCMWDLPANKSGVAYSDFEFTISAKIKIPVSVSSFNVFSSYVHLNKYFLAKPELQWDASSIISYPDCLLVKAKTVSDYIIYDI